jgi:Transglycosylase SLT domain
MRILRLLCLLLAAAALLAAGEVVVFRSGFRLHADRVEVVDEKLLLHTGAGELEFPLDEITGVEKEEYDPPPDPPPAVKQAAQQPPDVKTLVTHAAENNGLPAAFVHSVAAVESGYRPGAVSPKGAIGVMQLMPQTAQSLSADPHDPAQNVEAGARYLRELLLKYKDDPNPVRRALAAYNAGPGAVDKYDGVPPYHETQEYVEKVLRQYWKIVNSAKTRNLAVGGAGAAK